MNTAPSPSSIADEINRLHGDVQNLSATSRRSLDAALAAAWHAGHLLIAEKKRVRQTMGAGAWLTWLETSFHGTPRTAQRYMHLARSVSGLSFVQGLSLRQAYARLGIATEPKSPRQNAVLGRLAPHVSLANKLIRALRPATGHRALSPARRASYQSDLRSLYEQLRVLFESSSKPDELFSSGDFQKHRRS